MMKSILKKLKWTILFSTGILFSLFAASSVFADYCGHVASFKDEKNAIKFVHKMKARGLVAYYEKEEVPGKGEFYRTYIGGFKTMTLARQTLIKLRKSGDIDYFLIQKKEEKNEVVAVKKPESVTPKNKSARKPENKTGDLTQMAESSQKPENRTEPAAQNIEPVQKTESKPEAAERKNEPVQEPEIKTEAPIDTGHYYDGIAGIVLKNGKIIKGQIISIDDNDVLKIRTGNGKTLKYSFTRDVREYIMKN